MSNKTDKVFDPKKFYQHLIRPRTFDSVRLATNRNQVAGHAGFFSLQGQPKICLKPFNIQCVRGRREHLFYQLIEYFKRKDSSDYKSSPTINPISETEAQIEPTPLQYKNFPLLTYPSLEKECNCIIHEALFKSLTSYVANFYHVRHLAVPDHEPQSIVPDKFLELVYSEQLTCPCYGNDPKEKSSCSRDYEKVDFLCLEDLTAHCHEPCIIDIKIGQITYDPMAIKEKVLEQSSKYKQLRDYGFRILGMKLGDEIKDKTYGKSLETTEQVLEALNSFFNPLIDNRHKCTVIDQILGRLRDLLQWFENENINQLKFFSSSLLIVYDSHISHDNSRSNGTVMEKLANDVRVSMIDFAHVFHVHDSKGETDNNYMFGLKKLSSFFTDLKERHQLRSLPLQG